MRKRRCRGQPETVTGCAEPDSWQERVKGKAEDEDYHQGYSKGMRDIGLRCLPCFV